MPNALEIVTSQRSRIFARLISVRRSLDQYRSIQSATFERDVSRCPVYQRAFNGLYMVRRNQSWRAAYFRLLETEKHNPDVSFRNILAALFEQTGRIEASFASKLVATIQPSLPVYDSFVRINLGLPARRGSATDRLAALHDDYVEIKQRYDHWIASPTFSSLESEFDSRLPAFADLSRAKKLDLMLWQLRDRKSETA